MRFWRAVLTATIGLSLSATARAEPPLTLAWSAPPECPSEAEVASEVTKRLGGSTTGIPLAAKAKVTRLPDATWQVVLSTQQAGTVGERTLGGPTCSAVASATVLILALTIDPTALSRPIVLPSPTAPPKSPLAVEPPRPPRSVTTARRLFARVTPMVGLGVAANAASAGLAAAFGAVWHRLSIEVVMSTFLPESHDSAVAGAGGTFWLLAVGGEACGAAVDNPALRIGGCGGLEVQGMHGEGYGVSDPRTGVAGWAAPTASIFLDMKVASWLWFASRIDGIVPLSRPTFVLDDVGPVFRVNAVSARVAVGFEVRF